VSVIRYSGYLKKNPGINPGFFSLSSFRRNQVRYVFGIADISDCAIPHSQKLHRTTCRLVPWVHRLRRDGPLLLPRLPASWYSIHSYIGSLSSSWFTNSTPAHRLNRLQSSFTFSAFSPLYRKQIRAHTAQTTLSLSLCPVSVLLHYILYKSKFREKSELLANFL